ncbi:hypothetical protein Pcinc_034784 [Petrolisthes cinctipes]|uniref:Uncharacterized protein n=1 Tax=Petrolisthes cinctipes TaxID=88211 RepID=A0AAE1EQ00_PETCI|nr:hypothetical protein Pcinc_034784 [Petrolisthes cinctipes]
MVCYKTVDEVETKWFSVLSKWRKKIAAIRREYNQSGAGGSQVPPLDPVDIKVEELLGENNATIEGVMTLDNDVLYDEVRNEMTGSQANSLASKEGPAFIEISQDETQLQPLEEEASVIECTVLEPREAAGGILYSTPRARPVQTLTDLTDMEYKAEKRKLKLERMRLKNLNKKEL